MRLLGVAALLALVVRVAYVVVQTRFELFSVSFVAADSSLYLDIASGLAAGQGLTIAGQPTAYVGPGYPLFLAALLRLGLDPLGVGLVQCVLGAATAVLAGLSARRLARTMGLSAGAARAAAALGAFGTALYPHLIFWTGYLVTETLFVFLVAASLLATLIAIERHSVPVATSAGALAAAAGLTRAPYLAVAVAIVMWLLWRGRTASFAVPVAFAFAIACALPLAAWTIRNESALGAPVVTSTESGYVFWQGNSRGASGGSRGYVDANDFVPIEPPVGLDEAARDRYFLDRALQDVAADPFATIARWPAKIVNMWRPTYADSSLRNGLITLVSYPPVLVFGLAGTALLVRRARNRGVAIIPVLFLVTWFTAHVLVTGMIRFRLAAELVLLETAPLAILAGWSALRHRQS